MIRSFSSRIAVQLLLAFLVAVTGLFLARGGTALATTFSPTYSVTAAPTTPSVPADLTMTLNTPTDNTRWNQAFIFTPNNAFIAPGPGNPGYVGGTHPSAGAEVGKVTMEFTLGIVNAACNAVFEEPATTDYWTLENMTVQVGSMPTYIETIFTPFSGSPVQPLARYSATSIVSGSDFTWELVVFTPGDLDSAFVAPHPYGIDFTTALGYPMAIILSNPYDPVGPPSEASAVTDACAGALVVPEMVRIELDGIASDGLTRYTNPSGGSVIFKGWFQSYRDADGDGIENPFDTCPFVANIEDPRVTTGPDADMLDSACDPAPGALNVNQDGDVDGAGIPAPWLNAGDNCPLVANGSQSDDEWSTAYAIAALDSGPHDDEIGDACDPNPTTSSTEGHYHVVDPPGAVCIGGVDADGDGFCASDDPNDGDPAITPEHYQYFNPMPGAHSGAGGGLNKNPASDSNAGEPYQLCNDGIDNDGDGDVDLEDAGCNPATFLPGHPGFPTCPVDGCDVDTDGDGFTDEAEINLGTDALGRCGPGPEPVSAQWPLDLDGATLIPLSVDRISITDITRFLAPVKRLGASPGDPAYDPRFDLVPGTTFPFPTWIALNDLTALIAGATGNPPMFNGTKAFAGPACTAHPVWGD